MHTGLLLALLLSWAPLLAAGSWPAPPAADSLFDGRYLTLPDRPDPHGDPAACLACHTSGEPTLQDLRPESCRECHDPRAHHRRIHPLGMVPSDEVPIPAFMPLDEGLLACGTCHSKSCTPDRSNRNSLRGAPWPQRQDFCFQCHKRDFFPGLDPHHRPLRAVDQERLLELGLTVSCDLCHKEDEQVDLLSESDHLCRRCHPSRDHELRHMGFSMDPERNPAEAALYREYIELGGRELPLGSEGRIGCTTCHTPSPECGDQTVYPPRGLRLPLDRICHVCHGF